ncbi:HAD family hydrolase [Maribacter sp. 4G9]|uniref:HAD family hydrolase n=1 Tax=Maribacter sp. 4G9 TaxID=1889777 RepID=UPI000C147083|nr:HAD hydrolase-like protein [Maribacter sp. 4G9]PIB23030.1 hypothetical protein BFP75_11040 [Maribacter sp. 4G9]
MNTTIHTIKNNPKVKVVLTDLFDTLIHRNVHPLYVFKIWAKLLIRDLGLNLDIDTLYKIRMDVQNTLAKDLKTVKDEIPYYKVIQELHARLGNTDLLGVVSFEKFMNSSLEADYRSEASVQFMNDDLIGGLQMLHEEGYKIFIISDFHLPKSVIQRLLQWHKVDHLFNDIFMSCDFEKSKETGTLYPMVMQHIGVHGEECSMMGDNMHSDIQQARKQNINTFYLKHANHKFRNKKNLFGSVESDFIRSCRDIEKNCKRSEHPFSEYILHFYFFTERLYTEARQKEIKNLFFLAREGLYLKQLFDTYQRLNGFDETDYIRTHYFKASRHSAKQVSLRPIAEEPFMPVKKNYDHRSTHQFLSDFNLTESEILAIAEEIGVDKDKVIENFSASDVLKKLRTNETFKIRYEQHRQEQKNAFDTYLKSFGVDFGKEGMVVVDVGWGGTMQECIHDYIGGQVAVTGYYIGLREIYNIQEKTKRFGLNFSVYPEKGYSDHILQANGQLYEQLLAAPHGSTLGYSKNPDMPTIEYHEPNEKKVFDEFIAPIQDFMEDQFILLNNNLSSVVYDQDMAQKYLTDLALRLGLFTNKKKLKFIQLISQGFYQNIGSNKVGIKYDAAQLSMSKKQLLKQFLWSPEKTFSYLVKVKPLLYNRKLAWLGWTVRSTYYYIKANKWFKRKFFSKDLIS